MRLRRAHNRSSKEAARRNAIGPQHEWCMETAKLFTGEAAMTCADLTDPFMHTPA